MRERPLILVVDDNEDNREIARARLEALPWARLCIEEQEKYERDLKAGRLQAKDE